MSKLRPIEQQRQKRLMALYDWGKANIPNEVLFDGLALNQLMDHAVKNFGVTHVTAGNYATVVLSKLRTEAMPK